MSKIVITDSNINHKRYGGSSQKFGVTLNGVDYIVKLPEKGDFSVYSEYIASNIIRKLGYDVHEVYIAEYQGMFSNNIAMRVSLLRDFLDSGYSLHEFSETKQSSETTPLENKQYTYTDIVDMINKHTKLIPELKPVMIKQFWTQFVCDAILANRDRHGGNWGYIVTSDKRYIPAPIYDNGNSLFPAINSKEMELKGLRTRDDIYNFCKERVYTFPACIIMKYNPSLGRLSRTNYADMMKDFRLYPVMAEVVRELKSRISVECLMGIVYSIVNNCTDLDIVYKRFYIFIVCLRYACLVCKEPYDRAFNKVYNLAQKHKII